MPPLDYSRIRVSGPDCEPITLSEAKQHLRVVGSTDNEYIANLITMAREEIEKLTRLALITQTWRMKFNGWPSGDHFCLSPAPLLAVSSITYLDTNGSSQTLSTDVYEVDTARMPGVVWLKYDQSWPALRSVQNAITVNYTAGYGADGNDIPQRAKHAMLLLMESAFSNRGVDGGGMLLGLSRQQFDFLLAGLSYGDYP